MDKKVYSIKDDIFFDKNPEGIFILSPTGETLILDDDVAMIIWQELKDNLSIKTKKLVDKLLVEFKLANSERKDVENDVNRFLAELLNYELVEERNYEL
ncbi:PqqD family protein [Peribacillus frigoritolerans]|uniref:PqqD family protein n=1 Tax=Peribacillus frigoritolerans TaxID=450367 RepID=UPI0034E0C0D1